MDALYEFIKTKKISKECILNSRNYDSLLAKEWGCVRDNKKTHDMYWHGIPFEVKKQKGSQWFNAVTYAHQTENIVTLFIWYKYDCVTDYALVESNRIRQLLFKDFTSESEIQEWVQGMKRFKKPHCQISLTKREIMDIATYVV